MPESTTKDKPKPPPLHMKGAPPPAPKQPTPSLKTPKTVRIVNREPLDDPRKTRITLAIGTADGVVEKMKGKIPGLNGSGFTIEWADGNSSRAVVDYPVQDLLKHGTAQVGLK